MTGVLVVFGIAIGVILFLRWMAGWENSRVVTIVPANKTGLVITKPNTVERDKDGKIISVNDDGGGIRRVIHSVRGQWLDDRDLNPMNWHMVKGRSELRGLLFYIFDIQFIWLYRYLRISTVRQFRFGRKDNEDEYHVMPKTQHVRFAHFTGQHDIEQKRVETRGVVAFDVQINILVEETYPVRVRLKVADAYSVLTTMVQDIVINLIGSVDPEVFIGGEGADEEDVDVPDETQIKDATEDLKNQLTVALKKDAFVQSVIDATGITITEAIFSDLSFDASTRDLLEKKKRAKIEGQARVIAAKKDREAREQAIAADKKELDEVIRPLAELGPVAASMRWAKAHENNETATTVVYGEGILPTLQIGEKK